MSEMHTDPVKAYAEILQDLLDAHIKHLERIMAQIGAHCHGNLCQGHTDQFREQHQECLRLRTEMESSERAS